MNLTRHAPKPAAYSTVKISDDLTLLANFEYKGAKNAPWEDESDGNTRQRHYEVSFSLDGGGEFVSFDFWDSIQALETGRRPDARHVLEALASDSFYSTDPDEVFKEVEAPPSVCLRIAALAVELQEWFESAGTSGAEIQEAVNGWTEPTEAETEGDKGGTGRTATA